jgi:heterotetrameric sarcosine oxidase delta subunit
MSFILNCPHCGPRDVGEFRYGGEILSAPADAPESPSSNLPGPQWERWFHRLGCQRWLTAQRNVQTNEVLQTKEEIRNEE